MPFHRAIRTRRGRRKIQNMFDLQLTSMMDVLVIIVVFLLKSYATTIHSFTTVPGLKLPLSSTEEVPPDSLQVIVTPESMTFENEKILEFVKTAADSGNAMEGYTFKISDLDEGHRRIVPLYDALMKAKSRAEFLRTQSKARDTEGKPLPFEGILAIQADKQVQYDTIRKIMYTAGAAGYTVFRFLALKHES